MERVHDSLDLSQQGFLCAGFVVLAAARLTSALDQTMPVYLVPADHPDSPVPVDKPVLLIGRQAECDVILTCSRKVSRRHCCVVQISDWFVVRDLGSTNGIAVNGDRIANEAKFDLGDTLTVGDVDFEVVDGKFDVPKGKVCIGPALKANKDAGRDRQKSADQAKSHGRAESFRGIPASRPRRDGVREMDRDERRRKPERPVTDDPAERVTAAANRRSDRDDDRMVPDEFGSDTFGSDIENEELIAETFGSDMQDAYDPAAGIAGEAPPISLDHPDDDDPDDDVEVFRFVDSDDELDNEPVAPAEKPSRPKRKRRQDRGTIDPFADDEADDPSNDELVFEDDEPVTRPKPKRRKSRPRDESLKDDEKLDVESAVDDIQRSSSAQDSIIELDEFDLLD